MIPISTAKEAILLAQTLEAHGLKLSAEQGTPVGMLASALTLPQTDIKIGVDSAQPLNYDPSPEYISGLSDDFGAQNRGECTRYDVVMDNISGDVANAVRSHISYARNVVTPVIEDFVKHVQTDVSNLRADINAGYSIVRDPFPAPLRTVEVGEHLSAYEDSITEYEQCMTVPGVVRTYEELQKLIANAIPGLEDAMGQWIAGVPQSTVMGVYETYFQGNRQVGEETVRAATDVHLLIYLYAGLLKDNPGEDANISLSDWNTRCDDLHHAAGKKLWYISQMYLNSFNMGYIITDWNQSTNTVTVEPTLYDNWVEEGGSNALLFAAVMQRDIPRTAYALGERQAELMRAWERHVSMTNSIEESRKFLRIKEIIAYRLPLVVRDHAKEIYAGMIPSSATTLAGYEGLEAHQKFHTLLESAVQELRTRDVEDIWMMALNLVCDTVFHFTDAKVILLMRKKAVEINPDICATDSEFLARIEYVVNYVMDQMALSVL